MVNGKLIERADGVLLINIKDYLENQNIEKIMSFLDDIPPGDIKVSVLLSDIQDKEISTFLSNSNEYVESIIQNKYAQVIDIEIRSRTWYREPEFIKWSPGSSLAAHTDGPNKEQPPLITIAALIYLNDEYGGGELIFPEYDITIKPKFGDLIIFPCHYLHEVGIITGKNHYRYTLPLFYTFVYKENEDV